MSGQQPPPDPQTHGQPPPYPGPPPPQQPPPYPGQYGPPSPYGQPPPYPGPPGQPWPYPGQYGPPGAYPPYAALPEPRSGKPPAGWTARLIGWLIAATGVVIVVAAFLTWHTTNDWFGHGPLSLRGLGPDKKIGRLVVSQSWGSVSLILALVVISFAIVRMCGRLSLTAAILGVVMGFLLILYTQDVIVTSSPALAKNARGNDVDTSQLEWSTGIGAWLTLAAAVAMLVISIVGIFKRR